MKPHSIAVASQHVIQNFARLWPAGPRARRIVGVFALVAVLFVTGCSANTSSSPALAVITNPISQRVATGATAFFSATASGSPSPSLQWMVSSNGGTSYTALAGATSATLSFATTAAMNKNHYKAVFTNSVDTASTTAATLDVGTNPEITMNPTDVSLTSGSIATFTAAASATPDPTVQWMVSTNGGTSFSAVPGATSTTFSFESSAGQNGNEFKAIFTSTSGNAATTAAMLTVTSAPTITVNPINVTLGTSGTASFIASAGGNPNPAVQWMVSANGGASYSSVAGATSTTLSFTAALVQSGNLYEAVFTNSIGSSATTAATLTVTSSSAVSVAIIDPSTPSFPLGTGGVVNVAAVISNGVAGVGVNWSVNGVSGGDTTVGTITSSTQSGAFATYTAPVGVPEGAIVAIVATYAGAGSAVSPETDITIVTNANSALSGKVALQVRGFQLSGLPFGMVGTFTADGAGGISAALFDTNSVQSAEGGSVVTLKSPWTGSYAMDTVNHGILHLSLIESPAVQMNFGFVLNSGSGSLVEIDAPLGSTASGTFSAANPAAFTLAAGGLNGTYVMRIEGQMSGIGNGYNSILGQLTFLQTGSSTTSGTVTGVFEDNSGDPIFRTSSPGTVTMDADGSGHGTVSMMLDNGGAASLIFYVSNADRIFTLESDSVASPQTGAFRSQTIPSGGFNETNALSSSMAFAVAGVDSTTNHASVIIGSFSPDPDNPTTQVVGEFDANDGGTVSGSSPLPLTGTFIVDPTTPGRGTLVLTNAGTTILSATFYLRSQGLGYMQDSNGTSIGKFMPQTSPVGGFVNATLNGITTTMGTQTTTPASMSGVAAIHYGTGTYASSFDGSAMGQSPIIGVASSGTYNFTDAARGRAMLTPESGSMLGSSSCVFYSIDSTGAGFLISVDPATLEPQLITIGN